MFISIVIALCVIAWIATWIGAIFDMYRRADMTGIQMAIWVVIIVIFPALGLIAYILFRPSADKIRYKNDPPLE